ncbi:CPBP family glutamic-type intramembrane protease [Novosphingobium cyanobacteriorum]|uniref:CPBP family glutamic-type intramembrane protease n=1 Tax=Novosphingobium cyanobacteriorum TaxID=3024215 RepID=A0ABT6CJW3_9SPHN|nr:CPBP family glutamic-type intramembrane protease [Novosphingobium cyanobacteriorum]MDF8333573.1 CPBP family glutamic-type intramembrane protease [Novosphingobium cyanobacteriorum]
MASAMVPSLRTFATFLANPRPARPVGLSASGAWKEWGTLLALHLAVMLLVIAPLLKVWQGAFGLPAPDAFGRMETARLLPMVIVIAPVLEEIAFRGWMTGRPRALWLLACGLAGAAMLALVQAHVAETAASLGFVATIVAALIGWIILRKRNGVPGWFTTAFPALFWLSAIAFGLSHLINYPAFSWAMLPMITPQLWSGLLLGHVRLRFGLPTSMLMHGCANAVAIGLALALS